MGQKWFRTRPAEHSPGLPLLLNNREYGGHDLPVSCPSIELNVTQPLKIETCLLIQRKALLVFLLFLLAILIMQALHSTLELVPGSRT
jgi:hypothetical protein